MMNAKSYEAATEDVALADLSHRARWIVNGADAVRFIHGQCTNDVNGLKVGEGCYACFLTPKGKVRGDALIYRLREDLGIELDSAHAESLRQSLEKFIIADDVQIEDVTQAIRQGLVLGPNAAEFLRQHFPGAVLPATLYECAFQPGEWSGDVGICRTYRADAPGYELFAAAADFDRIWSNWTQAAPSILDAETLEVLRIEAGIPKFGVDMDENTIPIEAGLESLAISYTKGCYIGQEVISRIHSLGHVNRHLAKLRLAAATPLPQHGDKIQVDGRDIGQVTSAVYSPRYGSGLALGYVRREHATAGTKVSINHQPAEVMEISGSRVPA
jgi:folate-binding protein YgfZ